MNRYLLNVTFYAGSDDKDDTDNGLFLLCTDKEYTKSEIEDVFKTVNKLLDPYEHDIEKEDFPISYNQGLNICTLMDGISIYTEAEVKELSTDYGHIQELHNYYVIEQWQ